MFALIDGNNFFVSCERVFNPTFDKKPLIVLSNNDGCVIARSNEAKALGVRMAQPMFELKNLIKKYQIQWVSSNLTFYGDMSERMMQCIREHCRYVEVYSIDEAFVILEALQESDALQCVKQLSHLIKQWTGIPVSIGLAPTKTLAKMANALAKQQKTSSVFSLMQAQDRQKHFTTFPVAAVWGIGRKTAAFLHDVNIHTVEDLLKRPVPWLRKQLSVNIEKTIYELQGISCISLEEWVSKKAIQSSRSFAKPVLEQKALAEALSTYATMAAEKCRAQKGLTQGICIYISTSRFATNTSYYARQRTRMFSQPTQDTRVIVAHALALLKEIFSEGRAYVKCGIVLLDIVPESYKQEDIFCALENKKNDNLMKALDAINHKYRKNIVHLAAEGFDKVWRARSGKRSPNYTTQWSDLAVVT